MYHSVGRISQQQLAPFQPRMMSHQVRSETPARDSSAQRSSTPSRNVVSNMYRSVTPIRQSEPGIPTSARYGYGSQLPPYQPIPAQIHHINRPQISQNMRSGTPLRESNQQQLTPVESVAVMSSHRAATPMRQDIRSGTPTPGRFCYDRSYQPPYQPLGHMRRSHVAPPARDNQVATFKTTASTPRTENDGNQYSGRRIQDGSRTTIRQSKAAIDDRKPRCERLAGYSSREARDPRNVEKERSFERPSHKVEDLAKEGTYGYMTLGGSKATKRSAAHKQNYESLPKPTLESVEKDTTEDLIQAFIDTTTSPRSFIRSTGYELRCIDVFRRVVIDVGFTQCPRIVKVTCSQFGPHEWWANLSVYGMQEYFTNLLLEAFKSAPQKEGIFFDCRPVEAEEKNMNEGALVVVAVKKSCKPVRIYVKWLLKNGDS